MKARRYLVVIQDARGYPAGDQPIVEDPPSPPVLHHVVLAEDYDRLYDAHGELLKREQLMTRGRT